MQQTDLHGCAVLALCVRAGYTKEEAKLIAWASWMTDEWSGTQVKWPWQLFGRWNPGKYFHFVEGASGMVEANTPLIRSMVHMALVDPCKTPSEKLIRLGIALHAFMDSYAHQGFVGRLSRINEMGLHRRWLPPYGHTQLLRHPDRCEIVWTDSRTGEVRYNKEIFAKSLFDVYNLIRKSDAPDEILDSIQLVCWMPNYDDRKKRWTILAGMPDIRFSKIKADMWKRYGREFRAAAARQRKFLQS